MLSWRSTSSVTGFSVIWFGRLSALSSRSGWGARSVGDTAEILASRARDRAGPTAPPHGLFLMSVDYLDA